MKKIIVVCVFSLLGLANVCFAKTESKGGGLESWAFDPSTDFSALSFGEEGSDLGSMLADSWQVVPKVEKVRKELCTQGSGPSYSSNKRALRDKINISYRHFVDNYAMSWNSFGFGNDG